MGRRKDQNGITPKLLSINPKTQRKDMFLFQFRSFHSVWDWYRILPVVLYISEHTHGVTTRERICDAANPRPWVFRFENQIARLFFSVLADRLVSCLWFVCVCVLLLWSGARFFFQQSSAASPSFPHKQGDKRLTTRKPRPTPTFLPSLPFCSFQPLLDHVVRVFVQVHHHWRHG